MPSVYVNWSGRCDDESERRAIGARIASLVELTEGMMEQRRPTRWDTRIAGRVVAQKGLFPADRVQSLSDTLDLVPDVFVEGHEFRLADPRDLYPGSDRASFVFAMLADAGGKAPDGSTGTLVLVEDDSQCKLYDDELIQQASWFLCMPSIHLRYFAEDWIERLLAFIRHFHMPTLHYWHYEDLRGAGRYDAIGRTDLPAREAAWRDIQIALLDELAEWIPKGEELAAIRQHMLRTGAVPASFWQAPQRPLALVVEVADDMPAAERAQVMRVLIFGGGEFEAAVRTAIFEAGKGFDLRYLPLRFNDAGLALSSRLDGDTIRVRVRLAGPDAPGAAIAADEDDPAPPD